MAFLGDPWQEKREVCLPKSSPNEAMKEPRAEWNEELKTRLCLQWVGRRRWRSGERSAAAARSLFWQKWS